MLQGYGNGTYPNATSLDRLHYNEYKVCQARELLWVCQSHRPLAGSSGPIERAFACVELGRLSAFSTGVGSHNRFRFGRLAR